MLSEVVIGAALSGTVGLVFRHCVLTRRRKAEERRKRELAKVSAKADAERERQEQRCRRLKAQGPNADALLAYIAQSKLELDGILESVKDFFQIEDVQELEKWLKRYADLLRFPPYQDLVALSEAAKDSVLAKRDVEHVLEDFAGRAGEYADFALSIERKTMRGTTGWMMEKDDGSFEPHGDRYARILRSVESSDRGWIYALVNRGMPGVVKLGFTKQNPKRRAARLSCDSALPTGFEIAYSDIFNDCRRMEKMISDRLARFRVPPDGGFYRVEVATAVQLIKTVAREVQASRDSTSAAKKCWPDPLPEFGAARI